METSDFVVLIASILSLIGSLLVIIIGTKISIEKERRQLRYKKELDRLFKVEELAGELCEIIGGYKIVEEEDLILFKELDRSAGQLRRYPEVIQAIRDLSQLLKILIDEKKHHEDIHSDTRKDIELQFDDFIIACDKVKDIL